MICPKCKTDTLAPFNDEGIELDFCSNCLGVWLDKGELGDYHEMSADIPDFDKVKDTMRETEYFCPRCKTEKLYEMKYTVDSDVYIDFCKKCGGIFLDSGELGDIENIGAKLEKLDDRMKRLSKQMKDKGYTTLGDFFKGFFKK